MTDHTHIDGHNGEAEFEREDLRAKPILIFLIALIIGCAAVALALKGLYAYLDSYEARHEPVQSPLVERTTTGTRTVQPGDVTRFPQPRLETHETVEINQFRMKEENTLHSYGWVDQQAGVVHVPIGRAMELLVQRGLPTRPQNGAVPPPDVNVSKEAARRSDTSRQPGKKK